MLEFKEIQTLAQKALKISGSSGSEIERACWMVVHEYHHGVMPSEYDIREIDEEIFLQLLSFVKQNNT